MTDKPPPVFTVFVCGRKQAPDAAPCEVCRDEPHVKLCCYPLRGAKVGQVCGKRLCKRCATKWAAGALCPPHAKISATSTTKGQ